MGRLSRIIEMVSMGIIRAPGKNGKGKSAPPPIAGLGPAAEKKKKRRSGKSARRRAR